MSNPKQDKIDRILKRLAMIRAQPLLVDSGNEQYHDGFSSWYKNDIALMEKCKAGTSRTHDTMTIESANLLLT